MAKRRAESIEPDALTLCAISKCIKDTAYDKARATLKVGTYPIHKTIELNGVLSIAPSTPGAPASEAAGHFSPWLLLAVAMKLAPDLSVTKLAAAAAKLGIMGAPAAELALQQSFAAEAEARLPKVPVPAGNGKRGATSFSGTVQLADNLARSIDLIGG